MPEIRVFENHAVCSVANFARDIDGHPADIPPGGEPLVANRFPVQENPAPLRMLNDEVQLALAAKPLHLKVVTQRQRPIVFAGIEAVRDFDHRNGSGRPLIPGLPPCRAVKRERVIVEPLNPPILKRSFLNHFPGTTRSRGLFVRKPAFAIREQKEAAFAGSEFD